MTRFFQQWGNPDRVGESDEINAREHSEHAPDFKDMSSAAMHVKRDEIAQMM